MAHKTAGQTLYQQIRRVSVLGILVAMILATGAGLWLSLAQEQRMRDDTLTAAVQAAAYALALDGHSDAQQLQEYTLRTVEGIEGVDLFAVYDAQGRPVYYADIVSGQAGSAELPALDAELCRRLAQSSEVLLDDAETPLGADHCAVTAVRGANGTVTGYVLAGLYLRSIRTMALRTLGVFVGIGLAALGVGTLLSLQLARRIKSGLLGYEPDAFRDLFLRRMELLDALDEGLLAIDRDAHILYINRAAAEMLSFDKDAVLGRPLAEVYPQSTIPQVLRTQKAEYNVSLESLRHVRILSDRMPVWRDGRIVGAVAIFRNRTEVARLARELTGVQHIVEAMRAYTHEFMNKLHVILGLLQLGEAQRAEEYVLQLTQTRALSTRQISACIAEPSVAALLIGKSCRAAELGVRLTLDPASHLGADPRCLPAPAMITVLGNLIENAFDAFAQTPGRTLHEVSVSVREGEQGLILSVDDNACGMSDEVRRHLFERGATSKGKGHGTGLYLVKQIVDAYHGDIRVESTRGVGSSFVITFRPGADAPEA
ncbi:MAG TPA: Spo0B domain-containing protein [Candidatus Gemmiger excrementipullorum]|uniref:histidine kinase n=1 Tax=Candidatus Gemmiger excrementipullorum TaxID=2838610 RepID=A0A9D2BW06_9FIRM|nr:Spo0B domain-containing protein [Candidatus Gemmiger excrementipullorum]